MVALADGKALIQVYTTSDVREKLEEEALREKRSLSNMAVTLIEEAIEGRAERRRKPKSTEESRPYRSQE